MGGCHGDYMWLLKCSEWMLLYCYVCYLLLPGVAMCLLKCSEGLLLHCYMVSRVCFSQLSSSIVSTLPRQ